MITVVIVRNHIPSRTIILFQIFMMIRWRQDIDDNDKMTMKRWQWCTSPPSSPSLSFCHLPFVIIGLLCHYVIITVIVDHSSFCRPGYCFVIVVIVVLSSHHYCFVIIMSLSLFWHHPWHRCFVIIIVIVFLQSLLLAIISSIPSVVSFLDPSTFPSFARVLVAEKEICQFGTKWSNSNSNAPLENK